MRERGRAKKIASLISQSLRLDASLIRWAPLSTPAKAEFLAKKYGLLLRHTRTPFSLGNHYVRLEGRDLFYDSAFGIAGYERCLTSHTLEMALVCQKPVALVVDIGANVGYFSMLARRVYPDSVIHAFEPVPSTFECLELNLGSSGATHLHNLAVADVNGRATMKFDPSHSALSSLDETGDIQVLVTTLDHIVGEHAMKTIDILKIDTEGLEAHVLRGGQLALARTRYLFLEITIDGNDNYTTSSLLSRLIGQGYDFELRALRNFTGRKEGATPVLDCVFENVLLL